MKKVFLSLAIMFAVVCVNAQTDNVSFNLSMTVDKYIETAPGPLDFNFGTTTNHSYFGAPRNEDLYNSNVGEWNLAYANCPFSVTLEGDNPAGQLVPRFVRQEQGTHAGGFDVLNTVFQIGIFTNGVIETDHFGSQWGMGASMFPRTGSFLEAPHNGQVKMKMQAHVNSYWHPSKDAGIPIRSTVIDPSFTNIQSADAGEYTCNMTVTLTAL